MRVHRKPVTGLPKLQALTDVDLLRMLWAEAQQAGASPDILEKVKEYAAALDSGGKRAGTDAGVQGKPAKK
jgi:hypothetical protein